MSDSMRLCTRCRTLKHTINFNKCVQNRKDGLHRWCRECVQEKQRSYKQVNPEAYLGYRRKRWANKTPELHQKMKSWHHNYREKIRSLIREYYGTTCACCGENRPKLLTLDHIDGGGSKQRKELKRGGVMFYRWLLMQGCPEGYRTLCFNCNSAKGAFGKCPHEEENYMELIGACG